MTTYRLAFFFDGSFSFARSFSLADSILFAVPLLQQRQEHKFTRQTVQQDLRTFA